MKGKKVEPGIPFTRPVLSEEERKALENRPPRKALKDHILQRHKEGGASGYFQVRSGKGPRDSITRNREEEE